MQPRENRRSRARQRRAVLVLAIAGGLGILAAILLVGLIHTDLPRTGSVAQVACATLRAAASQWQAAHPGGECPTVEQLRDDAMIDKGFSMKDPWNKPYILRCEGREVTCASAGPDKKLGTDDDVVVPRPRS